MLMTQWSQLITGIRKNYGVGDILLELDFMSNV